MLKGLKDMKGLAGMMKQAQDMQQKMADMQTALDDMIVEGSSGAGMVKLSMTAKGVMTSLTIDPSLFVAEDKDVVEDLIIAAHNDAKDKAEELRQEEMSKMTGGMDLGGLSLPDGFKLPF